MRHRSANSRTRSGVSIRAACSVRNSASGTYHNAASSLSVRSEKSFSPMCSVTRHVFPGSLPVVSYQFPVQREVAGNHRDPFELATDNWQLTGLLSSRPAAIDDERRTSHVRRSAGGEEEHGAVVLVGP